MRMLGALLACGLVGASIVGCTPIVRVDDLVPTTIPKAATAVDKTLAVAPVLGGQSSESAVRVVANVEGAPYGEALVRSLAGTGLFREVRAGQEGDLVLHTEIISQAATHPPTVYALLVHYDLRDPGTGRVLWRRNIYSDALAWDTPHDAIGATWLPTVRGRTVQENLSELINDLSEDLPRALANARAAAR
jgi:hypothetical protein